MVTSKIREKIVVDLQCGKVLGRKELGRKVLVKLELGRKVQGR